VTAFSSCYDFM